MARSWRFDLRTFCGVLLRRGAACSTELAGCLIGDAAAANRAAIGDSRAEAFVWLRHRWLDTPRLDMFEFQAEHHPEFDEAIRASARQEVYAGIQHLIDEQLPLETLLKADFVVIDDVLADYYGIPNVSGSEFRKVAVPADSVRGGLLGAAATHIMGSDGQRSSPVERGVGAASFTQRSSTAAARKRPNVEPT